MGQKLVRKWAGQEWNSSQHTTGGEQSVEASVIIVGMGEVGRRVASALDANDIAYRAIEVDHGCFMDACSNGYKVGFGDATDLRLMDTIKMSHAEMIVITFADYEIASQLAPIVLERHPGLRLMVAVTNEIDKKRFDALGMSAITQLSFPRGLDMAVAVLDECQVEKKKRHNWMKRQQTRELEESLPSQLAVGASSLST